MERNGNGDAFIWVPLVAKGQIRGHDLSWPNICRPRRTEEGLSPECGDAPGVADDQRGHCAASAEGEGLVVPRLTLSRLKTHLEDEKPGLGISSDAPGPWGAAFSCLQIGGCRTA